MIFQDRAHRVAALCGALAMLAGAAFLFPAQAQQPEPTAPGADHPAPLELPPLPQNQLPPGEHFGDWVKRCDQPAGVPRKVCYISQILVLKQNDQRRNVLFVAIGYYGPQKVPGAILRVPLALGTYLPAGLQISVPGAKPVRVVFESCLPTGCNAAMKIEPDMITAMQKAARGTVELINLRRQKLVLPMSFKGFTAGFASLDKG